jgi:hypothetical protein
MKPLMLVLLLIAGACTSAPPAPSVATTAPLCAPGVQLGKVVVAPLTRWRTDQKEVVERTAIAQRAIESVLGAMPCASGVTVMTAAPDAQAAEQIMRAKSIGADTAVLIHIVELGPVLIVSFPALWSTWNEVKFTLDAVDLKSGQTLRSIPHHRKEGGAFEARGLAALQPEMEMALADVISGRKP